MDLLCPRVSEHLDDLPAGGPPDDRVIDGDHPFPIHQPLYRVEFNFHSKVADGLFRFNKGTSHIVISDHSKLQGKLRLKGVANGSRKAGVWDRNDHLRLNRSLLRQLSTQ